MCQLLRKSKNSSSSFRIHILLNNHPAQMSIMFPWKDSEKKIPSKSEWEAKLLRVNIWFVNYISMKCVILRKHLTLLKNTNNKKARSNFVYIFLYVLSSYICGNEHTRINVCASLSSRYMTHIVRSVLIVHGLGDCVFYCAWSVAYTIFWPLYVYVLNHSNTVRHTHTHVHKYTYTHGMRTHFKNWH